MRLKHRTQELDKSRPARMEPIAENINKPQNPPRLFFFKMNDEDLIGFAKEVIKEKGISGRSELAKKDPSLYGGLQRRKLLDAVGLESSQERYRDWSATSNCGLVTFAKRFILESKIRGRKELAKADRGLYSILTKRKLLEVVGLESSREGYRGWATIDDNGVVTCAKVFIAEKGIGRRVELEKADTGLYCALRKRKLLEKVGLPGANVNHRDWARMSNHKLVAHAMELIAEIGINGRNELANVDLGLYQVLRRRKLLGEVRLEELHRKWFAMEIVELIAHTKGFIAERGIKWKEELKKADNGLYVALRMRKLLDGIGLVYKQRHWVAMENDELIAYTKGFIGENGITGRKELEKADAGLYNVLGRRKLRDMVFQEIESSKNKEGVDGVLDALGSFGDGK